MITYQSIVKNIVIAAANARGTRNLADVRYSNTGKKLGTSVAAGPSCVRTPAMPLERNKTVKTIKTMKFNMKYPTTYKMR